MNEKEILKRWSDTNNRMLWTTATESLDVAQFWLLELSTALQQKVEEVRGEIDGIAKDNSHWNSLLDGKPVIDRISEVLEMNNDMGYNKGLRAVLELPSLKINK